jgi:hypothetical protein
LSDAFIETTPHHLSVLCVRHAALIIRNTNTDPQLWFLAIPDLHRALNCAFVAALRGTAGVGAYPPKLRHQWLKYFEVSRSGNAPAPTSERVQNFTELLGRMQNPSPDLQGDPLKLDVQQKKDLHKLNALRDDIEHVKPTGWSLEIAGLPRICRAAATALSQLYSLPSVSLHLSDTELAGGRDAVRQILEFEAATTEPATRPDSC